VIWQGWHRLHWMKLSQLHSTLETCGGQCHHSVLMGVLPYIAEAGVLAEGCLLAASLSLWCRMLAEVPSESCGFVEWRFVAGVVGEG
jgi:hypothetical protein